MLKPGYLFADTPRPTPNPHSDHDERVSALVVVVEASAGRRFRHSAQCPDVLSLASRLSQGPQDLADQRHHPLLPKGEEGSSEGKAQGAVGERPPEAVRF